MSRFEVKVRTFKNNQSVVRIVDAIAENGVAAGNSVLQLLGVDSLPFSVYVRALPEVRHEANSIN